MSTKPKAKAKPRTARKSARKPKAAEKKRPRKTEIVGKPQPAKEAAAPQPHRAHVPARAFTLGIRIRGSVGIPYDVESTMTNLRLKRKFNAVLLESRNDILGMLRRVKDYVTWGDINADTLARLLRERGRVQGNQHLTDEFVKEELGHSSVEELAKALVQGELDLKALWNKGVRPVFRLHPPSGGFRGSTKRPFANQGELGYRGQLMTPLLNRMI